MLSEIIPEVKYWKYIPGRIKLKLKETKEIKKCTQYIIIIKINTFFGTFRILKLTLNLKYSWMWLNLNVIIIFLHFLLKYLKWLTKKLIYQTFEEPKQLRDWKYFL